MEPVTLTCNRVVQTATDPVNTIVELSADPAADVSITKFKLSTQGSDLDGFVGQEGEEFTLSVAPASPDA